MWGDRLRQDLISAQQVRTLTQPWASEHILHTKIGGLPWSSKQVFFFFFFKSKKTGKTLQIIIYLWHLLLYLFALLRHYSQCVNSGHQDHYPVPSKTLSTPEGATSCAKTTTEKQDLINIIIHFEWGSRCHPRWSFMVLHLIAQPRQFCNCDSPVISSQTQKCLLCCMNVALECTWHRNHALFL